MYLVDSAPRLAKPLLWAPQVPAAELTLDAAVAKAREQAPQLLAQGAALEAAQARAVAAGRLPDPELMTGVDDVPVTTRDAGSFTRDEMTMRRIGVMQAFPSRSKRSADRQIARAAVGMARPSKPEPIWKSPAPRRKAGSMSTPPPSWRPVSKP